MRTTRKCRNRHSLRKLFAALAIALLLLTESLYGAAPAITAQAAGVSSVLQDSQVISYLPAIFAHILAEGEEDGYAPADLSVPVPYIFETDSTDPACVKVWGYFGVMNYNLENNTPVFQSGGYNYEYLELIPTGNGYAIPDHKKALTDEDWVRILAETGKSDAGYTIDDDELTQLENIMLRYRRGEYDSRIQSMQSMRKLTDYEDGYNLYAMKAYDYDLDNIINYGITDTQSMMDAILAEALPGIPVKISAPSFACTAFSLTDTYGNVQMGRNYDFARNTSAMLVTCTPSNGYKSVGLAALDNAGANHPDSGMKQRIAALTAPFIILDGMNEKGVSIAVLTVDSEPVHQNTGKPTIATSLAIRLVLDRAATTEEAIQLLQNYDMFAPAGRDYHFYINDASGDGRAVEYDPNNPDRPMVVTKTQVLTNFFIMYKDRVLPNQKNGVYGHGRERYDAVETILEETPVYTSATVWKALQAAAQNPKPDDITSNTQWSVNFSNTDKIVDIVLRRHWDDVFEYDLSTGGFIGR